MLVFPPLLCVSAFERSGMELTNLSSFHLLSHVGLDKVEHDIEAYRHNPGWHPNNPQTGFSQSMHEPLLPHDARVSPVQHAHQRLKGWKQVGCVRFAIYQSTARKLTHFLLVSATLLPQKTRRSLQLRPIKSHNCGKTERTVLFRICSRTAHGHTYRTKARF